MGKPNVNTTAASPQRTQMMFAGFGMVSLVLLVVMLGSVAALQDKNETTSLHATVAGVSALGAVGALWVCARLNRSIRAHSHQKQRRFTAVDRAVDAAVAAAPGPEHTLAVTTLAQLPFEDVVSELVLRVRDILIGDDPKSVLAAAQYTPPASMRSLVFADDETNLEQLLAAIPSSPPEEVLTDLVDLLAALEKGLEQLGVKPDYKN